MNGGKKILIASLLILFTAKVNSQNDTAQKPGWLGLHGYIKNLESVSFGGDADSLASADIIHNRLNFKLNISSEITARVEIRNRLFFGDQISRIPGFGRIIDQYPGYFKLSKLWVNQSDLVVHSVIDRLLLHYSTDKWDVQIGRQRINWGINNVWNPNDIFNAYNFLDFDYEERPGNDAVRVQHFLNGNTSVELAYKPGKEKDETIAAALYKFNRHKYDVQLLAGMFNADMVAGVGWAGSIREAGFKGELSYFQPRSQFLDTGGVVSVSLMADYTFKSNWYGVFSFLFNSNPGHDTHGFLNVARTDLTAKNLFPFRYSFYIATLKSFTPITSVNLALIYAPTSNTLVFFPSASWNAAKDLDIDLTAQSFFAKQANKYRSGGTAIFLRGRWSF